MMSAEPDEKKKLEAMEDHSKKVAEEKDTGMVNEELKRFGGHYRISLSDAKRNSSICGPGEKWNPQWKIYWDPKS
jgi:hypothetical protein